MVCCEDRQTGGNHWSGTAENNYPWMYDFIYGGGITYHFKTGKIETDGRVGLFLQEWKAAVIKVSVNGKLAGHIGWKGQDGLDITDYLQDVNEIDVKVITTPRNIFGPFHQKYDSCVRSSFKDFRTEGKDYTEEYLLEPQGLLKPVTLQKIQIEICKIKENKVDIRL